VYVQVVITNAENYAFDAGGLVVTSGWSRCLAAITTNGALVTWSYDTTNSTAAWCDAPTNGPTEYEDDGTPPSKM
jgi:hypothetical protein